MAVYKQVPYLPAPTTSQLYSLTQLVRWLLHIHVACVCPILKTGGPRKPHEFIRNHKTNSILKKKLAEEMRVNVARINIRLILPPNARRVNAQPNIFQLMFRQANRGLNDLPASVISYKDGQAPSITTLPLY